MNKIKISRLGTNTYIKKGSFLALIAGFFSSLDIIIV